MTAGVSSELEIFKMSKQLQDQDYHCNSNPKKRLLDDHQVSFRRERQIMCMLKIGLAQLGSIIFEVKFTLYVLFEEKSGIFASANPSLPITAEITMGTRDDRHLKLNQYFVWCNFSDQTYLPSYLKSIIIFAAEIDYLLDVEVGDSKISLPISISILFILQNSYNHLLKLET